MVRTPLNYVHMYVHTFFQIKCIKCTLLHLNLWVTQALNCTVQCPLTSGLETMEVQYSASVMCLWCETKRLGFLLLHIELHSVSAHMTSTSYISTPIRTWQLKVMVDWPVQAIHTQWYYHIMSSASASTAVSQLTQRADMASTSGDA